MLPKVVNNEGDGGGSGVSFADDKASGDLIP